MINEKNEKNQKTFAIALASYGSPNHSDVWQDLTLNTLKGHIMGVFGDKVSVDTYRIHSNNDIDKLIQNFSEKNYGLIGFSLDNASKEFFFKTLSCINKSNITTPPIIVGGVLATSAHDVLIENNEDFIKLKPLIVTGRGEVALQEYVHSLLNDIPLDKPLDNTYLYNPITGNYEKGKTKRVDLSKLKYPPAANSNTDNKNQVQAVQNSCSCYGKCSYCSQHGTANTWQSFPIERIKMDLESAILQEKYELEFVDEDYFGWPTTKHLERAYKLGDIINELRLKYHVNIQFRIFTNPVVIANKNVSSDGRTFRDLLKYYQNLGLSRVYLGIESFSADQRLRYHRRDSLDDCFSAIQLLDELGIECDAGFIAFDAESSLQDLINNCAGIRKSNLLKYNTWPMRAMILTYGTAMYHRIKSLGLLGVRSEENPASFTYKFLNPDVEQIYNGIKFIADLSSSLFIILKYFFKQFCMSEKHKDKVQTIFCFIKKNGELNLEYMEDMIAELKNHNSIAKSTAVIRQKLLNLVNEINNNIGILDVFDYDTTHLQKSINNTLQALASGDNNVQ